MNTRIPSNEPPPHDPDAPLSIVAAVTTHMNSAYDGIKYSQRHRITGFVGAEDYNYVFRDHLTQQGMQNKVITGLFFAFVREFKARLIADPSLNPYELTVNLINNATYGHAKETHSR